MKLEELKQTVELWPDGATSLPYRVSRKEFAKRYLPVIKAFAQKLSIDLGLADRLGEKVMEGFFEQPAAFAHRHAIGPFRDYLKRCTYALLPGLHDAKTAPQFPISSQAVDDAWNVAWENQQVRRALDEVREKYRRTYKRFRAFELRVIHAKAADEVAQELGMAVDEIEPAMSNVAALVRKILSEMKEEEG